MNFNFRKSCQAFGLYYTIVVTCSLYSADFSLINTAVSVNTLQRSHVLLSKVSCRSHHRLPAMALKCRHPALLNFYITQKMSL
jgi:hypothetical protein